MRIQVKSFLILLAVFLAALAISWLTVNHEKTTETEPMGDASFPVVYTMSGGSALNQLHGYAQKMNAAAMRDDIAQLDSNYQLPVRIDTYGNQIRQLTCTVMTSDGTETIGEVQASAQTKGKDTVTAAFDLSGSMTDEKNYTAVITVKTAAGTRYYYLRVANYPNAHFPELLKFVRMFHEKSMDGSNGNELASYLDTAANAGKETLQTVTLKDTAAQVAWNGFTVRQVTDADVSVKEIFNSYSCFTVNYMVTHKGDSGLEYYNVSEYYRVRYDSGRTYLVDFSRTANRIFSGEAEADSQYLNLGIRSMDVDYVTNESSNIVAFVQEGELWIYNQDSNQYSRVFSFRKEKDTDIRDNYGEHDIRIIRIDESGCVDFIVYGYMNRGAHEGQVGISVCHYDIVENAVEEMLFIPQSSSFQQMKEKIGSLMYVSGEEKFYFGSGSKVYEMDLNTKKATEFIQTMRSATARTSQDGRYLAWTESSQGTAPTVMHITDFETGRTTDIRPENGAYIRPLGFLGTDCIYGEAAESDRSRLAQGQTFLPISTVRIVDTSEDNKVLKTYQQKGVWFKDAEISSEGVITLNSVKYKNHAYVKTAPLTITNNELVTKEKITVETASLKPYQKIVRLKLLKPVSASIKSSVRTSELAAARGSVDIAVDERIFASNYYVYAQGKVVKATADISAAVQLADRYGGVVTDSSQNCVWSRAKYLSKNPMALPKAGGKSAEAKAVNIMLAAMGTTAEDTDAKLSGGTDALKLLTQSQGSGHVFNLTGCTLDEVLYYLGYNYPVYTILDRSPVLICGYTSANVTFYDPAAKKYITKTMKDAAQMFRDSGDIYYVYQKS